MYCSCGGCSNVWRIPDSLVTKGLSSIVDLATWYSFIAWLPSTKMAKTSVSELLIQPAINALIQLIDQVKWNACAHVVLGILLICLYLCICMYESSYRSTVANAQLLPTCVS